jgi:hypothetical protein
MVTVHQIPWEEESAPGFEKTTRQVWREAVAEIAEKAQAKLPECASRVTKAVALVLHHDVELLADGTAKVASQSNPSLSYLVSNGHCDCRDFARAPHNFCTHRLSAAIARRAQELVRATLADTNGQAETPGHSAQSETPPVPLPEAPASVNCHITIEGRPVQITLRGTDETRLLRRLAALLRHYPVTEALTPTHGHNGPQPGWCAKHGASMKLNHGQNGSTWYSHRTAEGWCKGR